MLRPVYILRIFVLATTGVLMTECTNVSGETKTTAPELKPASLSYDSCKGEFRALRQKLLEAYKKQEITLDSVGKLYTEALVNKIIPYWYGTSWDFNGYTAKPGEGAVACGYFVSTTLLHSGMNLNRYKMAQKSSMDGALMLEAKDSLFITYSTRDEFLSVFRKKMKDGLYMVGLSFHVGYLYKTGDNAYFIHSSYVTPVSVVQEKAEESVALGQSKIFVVADITYNKKLLTKWLNHQEIPYK